MIAYAIIVLWLLLLFLCAHKHCPAGLCFFGMLLSISLVLFFLLPNIYTAVLLVLRDGCYNIENVILEQLPNNGTATLVARYYLTGT